MIETFKRKNELGVEIEYSVIGTYEDNGNKYYIYTDFVSDDSNKMGLRLFVDIEKDGKLVRIPEELEKDIIIKLNKELVNFRR